MGNDLINFFNFETVNDGSQGGIAKYVDLKEGYESSMIGSKNGILYFGVETTKHSEHRKSFRLSSKESFSSGTLLVVDLLHLPATCGSWPALWTVAQDVEWPEKGEIDMIEGVNLFTQNSISIHTKSGFWMKDSNGVQSEFIMKSDQKTNCDATKTDDQGCGLRDRNKTSFGEPFNAQDGGLHVLEWTTDSIKIYFFDRGNIPDDLSSGTPSRSSSSWGEPRAKFKGSGDQSISDYFKDHVLVVNTNLCGKWPEAVWKTDTTYAGQSKSCASITGYDTCQDFITNAGDQLDEAYWAIKSVKVYH
ncbi:family 16 glycoside hydrolase [Melampsora americana]|nr:family 16 glycoside hydrolase [Melampsora americana]